MTARKTTQAMNASASWTPKGQAAADMAGVVFGTNTPFKINGGRLLIKLSVALDMTDPDEAARVAARIKEFRADLEATGKVHTFTVRAGAVPMGEAEVLPPATTETDDMQRGTSQ